MSDYISQTITVSSCQSDISNQCRIKTPCKGAKGGGGGQNRIIGKHSNRKKTKCASLAAEGYPSIICTIPMNRWFRLDNNSCTDILWTDALLSNLDSSLERRCPVCFEPFGILLGNGLFHFIDFCLMISAPRGTLGRGVLCALQLGSTPFYHPMPYRVHDPGIALHGCSRM